MLTKPALVCLIAFLAIPLFAQNTRLPSGDAGASAPLAQKLTTAASLVIGGTLVSLGMTKAEVEQNVTKNNQHIEWIPSNNSASVIQNDGDDLGQVTFAGGRLAYAAFHYPSARNPLMLAQEIAGAVEDMETKTCQIKNFSSQGTGGSHSDTIFYCGSKRFTISTFETIGESNRSTNVQIEIGEVPHSNP